MNRTNLSWSAQRGSRVHYAIDRASGDGIVVRVIEPMRRFLIRDDATGAEVVVEREQMRFLKTPRR